MIYEQFFLVEGWKYNLLKAPQMIGREMNPERAKILGNLRGKLRHGREASKHSIALVCDPSGKPNGMKILSHGASVHMGKGRKAKKGIKIPKSATSRATKLDKTVADRLPGYYEDQYFTKQYYG